MKDLYQNSATGIYADSPVIDNAYLKKMAWSGALADIASVFAGNGNQGKAISMPMAARSMREQQIQNKQAMQRQQEQDALNARLVESQITKNTAAVNSTGIEPIGAPQKLDNGNLGVVVEDPQSPTGVRVLDTGTAYREDPSLEQKLSYQSQLNELGRKDKYIETMNQAELAFVGSDQGLSGLYRVRDLLNKGVETGTFKAAWSPHMWKDAEAQEFISLSNEAVLKESEKLAGVLSETDMRFLQESTISINNTPEANQRILDRKIAILENGRAEAKRKYEHFQNGGNFFGWKPYWQRQEVSIQPADGVKVAKSMDDLLSEAGF